MAGRSYAEARNEAERLKSSFLAWRHQSGTTRPLLEPLSATGNEL